MKLCQVLRLAGRLEPLWGGYYILLKIRVLGNHLSSLSQKFRTTLVNLKIHIFSSRNTIRNCHNKQLLSTYYFELEVNVLV